MGVGDADDAELCGLVCHGWGCEHWWMVSEDNSTVVMAGSCCSCVISNCSRACRSQTSGEISLCID